MESWRNAPVVKHVIKIYEKGVPLCLMSKNKGRFSYSESGDFGTTVNLFG